MARHSWRECNRPGESCAPRRHLHTALGGRERRCLGQSKCGDRKHSRKLQSAGWVKATETAKGKQMRKAGRSFREQPSLDAGTLPGASQPGSNTLVERLQFIFGNTDTIASKPQVSCGKVCRMLTWRHWWRVSLGPFTAIEHLREEVLITALLGTIEAAEVHLSTRSRQHRVG